MVHRQVAGTSLVAVALLLSGCLTGSGSAKEIAPIAAPVWEPGFEWVYEVVQSSHESYVHDGKVGGDTDQDREVVTVRVFNTTTPLKGEDVYYLRLSKSVDHPYFEGNIEAVSRATLGVAGYGYSNDYGGYGTPPQPVMTDPSMFPMGPPPTERYDPCAGVERIWYQPPEERMPTFQFPLDDGQTFSGAVGEGQDMFAVRYTARTHGLVQVTVPAGTFPAIYTTVDMRPDFPEELESEFESFDFDIKSEYWFSPDARQIVKSVMTASAQGNVPGEGSFRFGFITSLLLRSYDLTAGPDSPAPVAEEFTNQPKAIPSEYRELGVVSSVPFPHNVADGPVNVTLGLQTLDSFDYSAARRPQEGSVGPLEGLDSAQHRIYWRIWSWGDSSSPVQETFGDTTSYVISRGGNYQIEAEIQPLQCGGSWLGSAYAEAPTIWKRSFDQPMEVGLPRTVPITTFPLDAGLTQGVVTWSKTATVSGIPDQGRIVLIDAEGRTHVGPSTPSGTYDVPWYPQGEWRLQWEATGPTLGDDIALEIVLNYGDLDSFEPEF